MFFSRATNRSAKSMARAEESPPASAFLLMHSAKFAPWWIA